jgi:uncharacterized membrane protein YdbT with pleckstrin-like domain
MAFPKHLLADHEKLVFDLRPHWIAVVPSILWTIVLLAAGIFSYRFAGRQLDGGAETFAQNAVAIVALVAIFLLAGLPFLRWRFTMFVLTSDRLITRSGIVSKHSKEIPLERINDVTFTQTIIERALGAGDLLLESAGERGQTHITNVRKPEQVQLIIYKETEDNTNRMMRPGGSQSHSIPEQIEALARLKDQGVLSEAEFDAKKQELLKRL